MDGLNVRQSLKAKLLKAQQHDAVSLHPTCRPFSQNPNDT